MSRRFTLGLVALAAASGASNAVAGDATNLEFPLDGTYTQSMSPNDDGSTGSIALPFTFNLYGTPQTETFINNNGNVSFGSAFGAFSSTGFPVNDFPMVAAFWADVDTRTTGATGTGLVWHKFLDGDGNGSSDTLVVTWDNVGYFPGAVDKLNTFQLAISDGTNPTMGIGNNVCFSFDDMQWTTGSFSGGIDGFGGTPATVGVNKGDGTNFFQIGRFDHAGVDYDGPEGSADGVDYLDGLDICFSVGDLVNQPPISIGFPAGPLIVDASAGETLNEQYLYIGPEGGQVVTVTGVDDPDGAQGRGLSIISNAGNPADTNLLWTPGLADIGIYNLLFTFEDDLGASNSQSLQIEVVPEPGSCLVLMGGVLLLNRRNRRHA